MEKADLHMHTSASDGQYTPRELIEIAKKTGLNAIAITDHDTIDGIKEALALPKSEMKLITGIEFSASEYSQLHILGYSFDLNSPEILTLCKKMKEGRDKRKYEIISFLNKKGVDITIEEVEAVAGGNIIARPHFARVLLEKHYVETNREAFNLYLDTEEFQDFWALICWKPKHF
ncbi:MAG: PHP domain-containing protein [Oscillospiraceae bacterium]